MADIHDAKLKLYCIDPQTNNERIFKYDNIHLDLYDENENKVSTAHLNPILEQAKAHDCKIRISEKPNMGKSNKIKHMRITIGKKCNFRCKYCIQEHEYTDEQKIVTDSDIEKFIYNCKTYLDFTNTGIIQFWGGEPLLYKDTIFKVTKALRKIIPEKTKIHTLSNGSLWTEKFVDECLDIGLQLSLSHDGPGQFLRATDPDPLTEGTESRKAILKYWNAIKDDETNNFSILCTATNEAMKDMGATAKYFLDIFGPEIEGRFNYKVLIVNSEMQKPYMLDFSQDAKTPFKIFSHLMTHGISGNGFGINIIDALHLFCNEQFGININRVFCFLASNNILVTDLFSNIYPCQNFCSPDRKMGTIDKLDEVVVPEYNLLRDGNRKDCLKCPVVALCMGGCPLVNYEYLSDNCKSQFVYNMGILIYMVYLITGTVLTNVVGDFPCNQLK